MFFFDVEIYAPRKNPCFTIAIMNDRRFCNSSYSSLISMLFWLQV